MSLEDDHQFRVVDFFCGAGGMTLGLAQAGFRPIAAFDNWDPAVRTYRCNIGDHVDRFDLTRIPDFGACDVIVGGPPCQGFSSAGRQNADDGRNSLVRIFANTIAASLPRAFVFENVEGFLTTGRGRFVEDLLTPLIESGYQIHLRKINAANFGVPQHRKRVVAIGGLGFDPGFPDWTHSAIGAPGAELAARGHPAAPSLWDAISDLPPASLQAPGDPTDHWYRQLAGEDLKRSLELKPGQTMRDLPEHMWHKSYKRRAMRRVKDGTPVEKRGGAPAGVRRLLPCQPCKSITGGSLRDFLHPYEHRPLTIREAARIQTYPDWFSFEGSRADRMQMVGNSVPPLLAKAIGESLLNGLASSNETAPRINDGKLLSFVPTLSAGMSPALSEVCMLVRNQFVPESDVEPLLWA